MTGMSYTRRGFLGLSAAAFAAGVFVPILIAYTILQRWIVGGLTAGATKG
jgi:raffinose/stachyose/melibiose transport system permease protein